MKLESIVKWGSVILIALALHGLLFAILVKKAAEKEKDTENIEIDLDMLQDSSVVDPNPSLAKLERQRQEEEKQKLEEEKRLAEEERKEEERLAKQKQIAEEKRLAEEKAAEEKRKEEAEKLAEQKRLDAIAWKKKQAEEAQAAKLAAERQKQEVARKAADEAKKKTLAEALRKKQAAQRASAAAARKAALAKKKVTNAIVTSRSKPSYPKSLQRKNISGTVKLRVHINSSGKVSSISVYKSSGHSAFDKSALRAAKRWKYKPAKNGLGISIPDTKIETIVFQLK